MNKSEALALVANHMAGLMGASTLEEVTGLSAGELDRLSDANIDRLAKAAQVVEERLRKLAGNSHT